jgi:hypothetical protein
VTGVALRYWNELYVPADVVDDLRRQGGPSDPGAATIEVERWGFRP